MLGETASFRAGQWEAIRSVLGQKRTLVVQRTGWGKSVVYFIAARLLRDRGSGPALLISPLLSLMRNQMEMARKLGLRVETMNSTNTREWKAIRNLCREDCMDLILISPEHLGTQSFREETLPSMPRGIGFLVIDEAHCISDWGHDFRPDYRRLVRIVRALPPSVPVLGTTATANDRVVEDVGAQLGHALVVHRGPLARTSHRIQIIHLDRQEERLAWLKKNISRLPGTGVVYCLTQPDCERVARWLYQNGIDCPAYHAGVHHERRLELEQHLLDNQVKGLVATIALGMGFDKPDLGFVVHFQRPPSVVAYYQQIGRAGRNLEEAPIILLAGKEDDDIAEYFIKTAFPPSEEMILVLETVAETGATGCRSMDVESRCNLPRNKSIEKCLKLLTIDGALEKRDSRYYATATPWTPDEDRIERVTRQRYEEMELMRAFTTHEGCLMEFISRALNDPDATPCGKCMNCDQPRFDCKVEQMDVLQAVTFLRGQFRIIKPRLNWAPGALEDRRGRIPEESRMEEGRALSLYNDAGWGWMVKQGKYRDGRFSEELVAATVTFIQNWSPNPPLEWIAIVPSLRRPNLLLDFAIHLSHALKIPLRPALRKIRETPAQKTMENSVQQLRNIANAFAAVPDAILPGPVFLVDDIVDSRWTLTWCAAILREAGAGPVFPLALSEATAEYSGLDS